VFLSYSRKDQAQASALDNSLTKRGLTVLRDIRVDAGADWAEAIEKGIRRSRAVVVLISTSSATSEWVSYEYAFARGAGVPIVGVIVGGEPIPGPLQRFQNVPYTNPRKVALQVHAGFSEQSRAIGQNRAIAPTLVAKFREINGEPAIKKSRSKPPELWIEMWFEQVPKQTRNVEFEILDKAYKDPKWRWPRGADVRRAFLFSEMYSYGDIEIWARGIGSGPGNWSGSWRLYEALTRFYRSRSKSAGIRTALRQIKDY
jgi:hypothetical protein